MEVAGAGDQSDRSADSHVLPAAVRTVSFPPSAENQTAAKAPVAGPASPASKVDPPIRHQSDWPKSAAAASKPMTDVRIGRFNGYN
jgi:hypothetical protein